jgi:putative transposase
MVVYGWRKMTAWLRRNGFAGVSKHTVDRLMREAGMSGVVRGRRTRTTIAGRDGSRRGAGLLNRCFSAPAPNVAWVTGFTFVSTWAGFVYVAFAIDLFSRAIVGWSTATVKDVPFVEECLQMALWRRDHAGHRVPDGMIHHSDAGSTSIRFTETPALNGLAASVGSVGDEQACYAGPATRHHPTVDGRSAEPGPVGDDSVTIAR